MGDEKSGPYKVVGLLNRDPRLASRYMIVVQERHDSFEREVIPDAGVAETARKVCNLLNKAWKEAQDDEAAGTDVRGLDSDDQPHDSAG